MTIAEVSKKTSLSAYTLRYYEKIGIIPEVERNENGTRNYSDYDIGWIEFSKCMRSSGMSIEAIIEYIKLYNKGDSTLEERKTLLIKQRENIQEKLNELQSAIDRLNVKIEKFDHNLSYLSKNDKNKN
ncbi:MerR family transcriptional regulator [uncultured Brachyspira sp.]|uniref:MerR family transcriptional regulator n=1 Tax=uncultured Brachyspira sp. TaxID=221953 RepID=UPI0025DB2239|nr:MerR family transcriptional regulator [uncultured Brachyspira sp.]